MIITQISTAPGGAPASLTRQELTSAVGDLPLRVFRRTLWIRIPTGGIAERLEISPGAILRGSFGMFEYNAVTTALTGLRASVSAFSGGVLVTMDSPRQVVRVTLAIGRAGSGSVLEFYRLDGDTPAESPTTAASPEGTLVIKGSGLGVTDNIRSSRPCQSL